MHTFTYVGIRRTLFSMNLRRIFYILRGLNKMYGNVIWRCATLLSLHTFLILAFNFIVACECADHFVWWWHLKPNWTEKPYVLQYHCVISPTFKHIGTPLYVTVCVSNAIPHAYTHTHIYIRIDAYLQCFRFLRGPCCVLIKLTLTTPSNYNKISTTTTSKVKVLSWR